jgi:hypothetical protein
VDFNENHPVWNILRIAVIMAGVIVFSWLNASKFDVTEWTTIVEVLLLIGGFEGAKKFLAKSPPKG